MLITHCKRIKKIDNNLEKISALLLIFIIPLLATGPFLPDLFLSIFSILFLIKILIEGKFNYKGRKLFFYFLIYCFYIFCLSIVSVNPLLSLEQSLFYFRFGLFVLFSIYIFNKYSFL